MINLRTSEGIYFQLFTLYEYLESGMQDKRDFIPNYNGKYIDRCHSEGGKDSVYFVAEEIVLTSEMIERPWDSLVIGSDNIKCFSANFEWRVGGPHDSFVVPLHSDNRSEINNLLPHRLSSAYVNYCIPIEHKKELSNLFSSNRIRQQLSELSTRNMGFDIMEHTQFLGSFVFVSYNPIYKKLDMRKEPNENGIFFRTCYRKGHKDKLIYDLVGKDKEGNQLFHERFINDGKFLCLFKMPKEYKQLELTVRDEDERIIDIHPCVVFLESIVMNMQIKTSEVHVKDKAGKVIKKIEKFVADSPSIIGKNPQTSSLWDYSPEYSYKKLEEALDFVFFDGDRSEESKMANKQKALDCIQRILNSARKRIMICDVYFDAKALEEYVVPIHLRDIEVDILSSKEGLSKDNKRDDLQKLIDEVNQKHICNVKCRLFKGDKPLLHDRFIIADDNVWMLGCSLNEFSVRATSLIRVPRDYRGKLIQRAKEWWKSDDLTCEM